MFYHGTFFMSIFFLLCSLFIGFFPGAGFSMFSKLKYEIEFDLSKRRAKHEEKQPTNGKINRNK